MSRVEFRDRKIFRDGNSTQIISGGMHYFRVPNEYWRDRMEKAVQLGLNCIETYMCWNLHERDEGQFDFSGMLDFEAFMHLAWEYGLYVIVRPGPYICSEWDNGALPSWLMTKPGIRFRRMNKPYMDAIKRYFDVILPKLAALQYDNGGPIIAMQIENEYGSYSCDKEYLAALRKMYTDAGLTIPFFTADGPGNLFVQGGTLEGAPMCLNFGSRGLEAFDFGKSIRPQDPSFCTEFWCGWFDVWGTGEHHVRSAESVAEELDDMLSAGGSVDFYMYHGGTNFEFTSGANGTDDSPYTPDVTSYDYDSLLDEAGDPTEKYFAVQEVIRKHAPTRKFGTPIRAPKMAPCRLPVTGMAPLFDHLDEIGVPVRDTSPLTFEELNQHFGYVYYRTTVPGGNGYGAFTLRQVRDRADVYLNREHIFTYFRNDESNRTPAHDIPKTGAELSLLVENMGRINYGHKTGKDSKGICEDVAFEWQNLVNWEMWCLPSKNPPALTYKPFDTMVRMQPAYYTVDFDVDEPRDAFLKFPGVHGGVWLNGRVIGRYWSVGPGHTLYLPGCWMKPGKNQLVIFETEKLMKPYVDFVDCADLKNPL